MRVLFISSSPIRKDISIGNTFLNVFDGIEDVEFAGICTKSGAPDPSVSRCFCITEKMLIRNLLGKGKAGKELDLTPAEADKEPRKDSGTTAFAQKKRWNIFFCLQNALWWVGRWKSPQLKAFVEEYQPDIVFTVLSEKIYLNRLIRHVAKLADKKLIVYAWDNNYSLKRLSFSPFDWIGHFFNRRHMRKTVAKADKLYVISNVQKTDYEKAFKKPCTVLTKAEDFTVPPRLKETFGSPLQLVYTGNLYANRWKSLAMLAEALRCLNQDGIKAQLRIYSGSTITSAMTKALEAEGSSFLMGSVPSSEIVRIQSEADMLVHVEATDLKNRLTVRQSFSTKLVDYFKAARPIVAVGPKTVASIKHLIDNDAAVTAETKEELYEKLRQLIDHPQQLQEYAVQAYMCGRTHHDKKQQKELLRRDIAALLEE